MADLEKDVRVRGFDEQRFKAGISGSIVGLKWGNKVSLTAQLVSRLASELVVFPDEAAVIMNAFVQEVCRVANNYPVRCLGDVSKDGVLLFANQCAAEAGVVVAHKFGEYRVEMARITQKIRELGETAVELEGIARIRDGMMREMVEVVGRGGGTDELAELVRKWSGEATSKGGMRARFAAGAAEPEDEEWKG